MRQLLFFIVVFLFIGNAVMAQENNKKEIDETKSYIAGASHEVKTYTQKFKSKKPENIILMIGDGMGVTQVYAGLTANKGHLFIENMKSVGFSKTYSASGYTTDSAAGGTALATGEKTYNGAVSVDIKGNPVKTVLECAQEKEMATGLVVTSRMNHATPAVFMSHQKDRGAYDEIAADFVDANIDVFIGGGLKHFNARRDGRNLLEELKQKGYSVQQDMEDIVNVKSGRLAGLVAQDHVERARERKEMLPVAVETAINILSQDKDGFFMMIEGSQIDFGGHENNTTYMVEEMLDFDRAVGRVLDFASKDGKTLVVVTADHECGGLSILNGNMKDGKVTCSFATSGHTGVMVPVFSYGPGAEIFEGIMENSELGKQLISFIHDK